jgi:hypothetical protein
MRMQGRETVRGVLRDAVLDAVVPAAVYAFARRAGSAEVPALLYAAIVPGVMAAAGYARRRAVDPVAAIVLFAIVVSVAGFLLGGGPRVLLIRESFVSLALGVACLVSFALPRPLMFYFGRWYNSRGDAAAAAAFDARWSVPLFRRVNRLITAVWAAAFLGEFGLRVLMVLTFPTVVVLAVAPLVLGAVTAGTIVWTFAYIARVQRSAVR